MATLGLGYEWDLGFFQPRVGAHAGVEWIVLSAEANENRPSFARDVISPLFQVDAGASLLLSRHVGGFVRASLGGTTSPPSVTFDGREVADFSHLAVSGTLGVEFRVP